MTVPWWIFGMGVAAVMVWPAALIVLASRLDD
jgi:hypothetical protein